MRLFGGSDPDPVISTRIRNPGFNYIYFSEANEITDVFIKLKEKL